VEGIYERLKAEGFEPWMDKKTDPCQNWQREIPLALQASALVLSFCHQTLDDPATSSANSNWRSMRCKRFLKE